MKRFVSLFLAFAILFLLCSCEEQLTPVTPEASKPGVTQTEDLFARLDELPDVDFGGREFRIAAYQADSVFPENTETTLTAALQKRNESVEKKFNIKLKNAAIEQDTFFATLQEAYASGQDVCDIVVAPYSMAASFLAADMLLNVNSLPYTNYSKTYFNSDAMDAASLGAVTYEIIGDFVASPTSQWAVCYNISLMEWYGFTNFVTLARNGQWTWALFNKYVQAFYRDKNGDRVLTDKDWFGYTASVSDETLMKVLWASSGIEFFENDPPKAPQMDFDGEDTAEMIKAVKKALQSPGRYTETLGSKSALQMFLDGQSLFYICPASTIGYLQLQGMNVGMLPLPKISEQQEHFYSYVDPSAPVVYVLNNCRDTEFVGRVVQGLFAASENLVYDATLQIYSAFHLTGNAAVNFFIDMIKHGYYDPSFVLGDSYPELKAASIGIVEDVIYLNGNFKELYETQLNAFNKKYSQNSLHSYEDGLPEDET